MDWKFPDAANRLDEIFGAALSTGPQRIEVGDQSVYVISETEYLRLTDSKRKPSFKEFLLNGPDFSGLDLTRDKSTSRDIEF